jgi:hypothetical protein
MSEKLIKSLGDVQFKLKAPKGQTNNFGHYNYRSCEDILEAVKPLLHEAGLTLTLSDDVIAVGNRVYVKATATVTDGTESISNTAFAREAESKKGMDDSQVTGTASSYARKYALNGLFCIDDTKDADTDEYQRRTQSKQSQSITCDLCHKPIKPMAKRGGGEMSPEAVAKWTRAKTGMTVCGDCYKQREAQQTQSNGGNE